MQNIFRGFLIWVVGVVVVSLLPIAGNNFVGKAKAATSCTFGVKITNVTQTDANTITIKGNYVESSVKGTPIIKAVFKKISLGSAPSPPPGTLITATQDVYTVSSFDEVDSTGKVKDWSCGSKPNTGIYRLLVTTSDSNDKNNVGLMYMYWQDSSNNLEKAQGKSDNPLGAFNGAVNLNGVRVSTSNSGRTPGTYADWLQCVYDSNGLNGKPTVVTDGAGGGDKPPTITLPAIAGCGNPSISLTLSGYSVFQNHGIIDTVMTAGMALLGSQDLANKYVSDTKNNILFWFAEPTDKALRAYIDIDGDMLWYVIDGDHVLTDAGGQPRFWHTADITADFVSYYTLIVNRVFMPWSTTSKSCTTPLPYKGSASGNYSLSSNKPINSNIGDCLYAKSSSSGKDVNGDGWLAHWLVPEIGPAATKCTGTSWFMNIFSSTSSIFTCIYESWIEPLVDGAVKILMEAAQLSYWERKNIAIYRELLC